MTSIGPGGYDEGYRKCSCFWGSTPGSMVLYLEGLVPSFRGWSVLDLGCGEGKNSAFFSARGASVLAVDISELAIEKARRLWQAENIEWKVADVRSLSINALAYDAVVLYGLLHCLSSVYEVCDTVRRVQLATKEGGYNILCVMNDRHQELEAHPGFSPCLIPHSRFLELYEGWRLVQAFDADLSEVHPHNGIPHCHSMTRLIAQRV